MSKNFYLLLGLLSLSAPAFSQTCYVDMVDRYNRVVRSFIGYGDPSVCYEGMKECRKAIRLEPHLGGVDCIKQVDRNPPRPQPQPPRPQPQPQPPRPQPQPQPYPQPIPQPPRPQPQPQPQPGSQYPTYISIGERVYNVSNSRYADVIAQDYQGKFVLRYADNGATGTGWDRRDLAPMRGCDYDICVNDLVYNTSNSRYAVVVALQMTNKFVLKYQDNGLTGSGWDRSDLAVMEGCQLDICVNDEIYNVSNSRYAKVVGIQSGNRFVLRYQDNGLTGSGWQRNDIAVMNGCQANLCVGSRVINLQNRRYARIVALQAGNKFVLRYEDNGLSGSGWSYQDIAVIR